MTAHHRILLPNPVSGATKIHANCAAPLRGSLVQDLPVVTKGRDTAGVDIALPPWKSSASNLLVVWGWWFGFLGSPYERD